MESQLPISSFLVRHRIALFLVVMLGSCIAPFLFETPFNAPFYWAGRYLTIPILVVVTSYTYLNRRELVALNRSGLKSCLLAAMVAPLLILFSAGWVDLVNGCFGVGTPIRYDGVIQAKFGAGARSRSWQIKVHDEVHDAPIVFTVPASVYASLQVGDRYSRTMQMGCLGMPYASRHEWK